MEAVRDIAFGVHVSQLAVPILALKKPEAHATHAPGTPLKPGAHMQDSEERLAGGDMELGGHVGHPLTSGNIEVRSE